MSDLISRQQAIDLWEKYHPTIAVDAIQYDAELRQLPSAQPERKKGRWERNEEGVFCSCCYLGWNFITGVPAEVESSYNFCPNCGARMNEE